MEERALASEIKSLTVRNPRPASGKSQPYWREISALSIRNHGPKGAKSKPPNSEIIPEVQVLRPEIATLQVGT